MNMKVYKNIVFEIFGKNNDIKQDGVIIQDKSYKLFTNFDMSLKPVGLVSLRMRGKKLIGDITVKDEKNFDENLVPVIGYKAIEYDFMHVTKSKIVALSLCKTNIDPLIKSIKEQNEREN